MPFTVGPAEITPDARKQCVAATPLVPSVSQRPSQQLNADWTWVSLRIHRFFDGGYVVARGLFSADQLDVLDQWSEEMPFVEGPIQQLEYNDAGEVIPNRTEALADFHKPAGEFLRNGPLPQFIAELIGHETALYKDKLNYKAPYGGGGYAPHQDIYDSDWLGVDPALNDTSHLRPDEKFYVCMIAVDESTPLNGCPAVAPGCHLHGLYQHTSRPEGGEFRFDDKRAPNDESMWLPCPLARGDVLIYDNYMPHKSAKNESESWRRALFGVYNSLGKGDFREDYYRRGRTAVSEGGNGRWATVVANKTGVGAATIVTGADGTGQAVLKTPLGTLADANIGAEAAAAAAAVPAPKL